MEFRLKVNCVRVFSHAFKSRVVVCSKSIGEGRIGEDKRVMQNYPGRFCGGSARLKWSDQDYAHAPPYACVWFAGLVAKDPHTQPQIVQRGGVTGDLRILLRRISLLYFFPK
jgi:hypothetical protein